MKSHDYAFNLGTVGRLLASLIVPLIGFAVILRLSAICGILPRPWPALDVEHTVLTHQALASQATNQAATLLIGDSSCLMDVMCDELEGQNGHGRRAVNLGTFMYLGFDGYAAMLSRYASANHGRLHTVVVLVHPEMLRGFTPVPQYTRFVSTVYAGEDYGDSASALGQLRGMLGLDVLQSRLLSRTPQPLPKEYGYFYGFNLDLYSFMDRHSGSALDPHEYRPGSGQGNAEYRLANTLEPGCRALKAAVPPDVELVVGLTPIPESFAPPDYKRRWIQLSERWSQWIGADRVLTNLPATLPDSMFASTTHLRQQGAREYTRLLGECLNGR
jgi:hypothetical protein